MTPSAHLALVQGTHCVFCFKHRLHTAPTCSYGLGHEHPAAEAPRQSRKVDMNLCTKCGLHRKNPAQSACSHEYP